MHGQYTSLQLYLNYWFYISAFLLSSEVSARHSQQRAAYLSIQLSFQSSTLMMYDFTLMYAKLVFGEIRVTGGLQTDGSVYYLVTLVEAGHAGKAYLVLLLSINA